MDLEFCERFRSIARAMFWSEVMDPWEATERWSQFVRECANGYSLGYFEYLHDLLVRDLLEAASRDEIMRRSEDFGLFLERLNEIDRDFREMRDIRYRIKTDPEFWWKEYLPKPGGEALAEDVLDLFGYRISGLGSTCDNS
jgi:hypothetical protein